jgi:hypothetical protein
MSVILFRLSLGKLCCYGVVILALAVILEISGSDPGWEPSCT